MMLRVFLLILLISLTKAVVNNEKNYTNTIAPSTEPLNIPYSVRTAYMRLLQINTDLPVLVLVDITPENQLSTAKFFRDMYRYNKKLYDLNFVLIKFGPQGVSSVLESTFNNVSSFLQHLEANFTETAGKFSGMMYDDGNHTSPYYAILNAAYVLQKNSTIMVFLGRKMDETLSAHALKSLLDGQITLLVIWNGPLEYTAKTENLLYEIAISTGGAFYQNEYSFYSLDVYQAFLSRYFDTNLATILTVKNLTADHFIHFPIDTTIQGFHITITYAKYMSISLAQPNGKLFDVKNEYLRKEYSFDSFSHYDSITQIHEIHLNITSLPWPLRVGLWNLNVKNKEKSAPYNITITAFSKLVISAVIYLNEATDLYNPYIRKNVNVSLMGDYSGIRKISFVSQNGTLINNQLNITKDLNWEHSKNGDYDILDYDRQIHIDVGQVPRKPFFIVIDGKDNYGNSFLRESYVATEIDNRLVKIDPLTVQVSLNSELFLYENKRSQLYFEITNNGNQVIFVQYFCSDKESILLSMIPRYHYINPQETRIVRVSLIGKPGKYTDNIAFSAHGPIVVTKHVQVESGNNYNYDKTNPVVDYEYTSDCLEVLLKSCHKGTWSVTITAKDNDSGMLQLATNPTGIYVDDFTIGTNDTISGVYGDSCCYPKLQIIATDRKKNRKIVEIDAYRVPLDAASVAAVVFAVIVFILLIIIIACAIRKAYYQKSETYDLPTYEGPVAGQARY